MPCWQDVQVQDNNLYMHLLAINSKHAGGKYRFIGFRFFSVFLKTDVGSVVGFFQNRGFASVFG